MLVSLRCRPWPLLPPQSPEDALVGETLLRVPAFTSGSAWHLLCTQRWEYRRAGFRTSPLGPLGPLGSSCSIFPAPTSSVRRLRIRAVEPVLKLGNGMAPSEAPGRLSAACPGQGCGE